MTSEAPKIPGLEKYSQSTFERKKRILGLFERKITEQLPQGTTYEYEQVRLDRCTSLEKQALGDLILEILENPSFLGYSEKMPYTQEEMKILIDNPQAIILLAWEVDNKRNDRHLVGYLSGIPGVDENIKDKDVTRSDGSVMKKPHNNTFFFDTYAVREDRRGRQIGKNLFRLFRETIYAPDTQWDSLAVFALKGARTLPMLEHDSWIDLKGKREKGLVSEGDVPYRGWFAHYTLIEGLRSAE